MLEISAVNVYLSVETGKAMNETAERLMDLAEARIREAGYRGFRFRDLAAEIGIKRASVSHHFPTKAGMAAAVARRYGDRFFEVVARRHDESGDDVIAIYRSAFRSAIERDGRMCLNGVLGAEAGGLPPEVVAEIEMFFRRCIANLSGRIGGADAVARAFHVMAGLGKGPIFWRACGDISSFDQATAGLTRPRFAVAR